jgi:hypothetical protein
MVIPTRIAHEEIGDAAEQIHRWETDPQCRHAVIKISLKAASVILYTAANTVRCIIRRG